MKTSNEFIKYEISMPGFSIDEIRLTIKDGTLFVVGDNKYSNSVSFENESSLDFTHEILEHSIKLPNNVVEESGEAKMMDGKLKIKFPIKES